jgi:hypothetical protein
VFLLSRGAIKILYKFDVAVDGGGGGVVGVTLINKRQNALTSDIESNPLSIIKLRLARLHFYKLESEREMQKVAPPGVCN